MVVIKKGFCNENIPSVPGAPLNFVSVCLFHIHSHAYGVVMKGCVALRCRHQMLCAYVIGLIGNGK